MKNHHRTPNLQAFYTSVITTILLALSLTSITTVPARADEVVCQNQTYLGSYDTPGDAERVIVVGTTAYVADRHSGLQIIDISDPTAPTFLGSIDTPHRAFDVTVVGTTAYIAANGLLIIDVSDCPPCLADLTNDGLLNFFDISAFLTAFGDADLAADFNSDGLLNFFDISAFMIEFAAGCP